MSLDDIIPGEYLSNQFQIQPSPTPIPEGQLRAYLFHHEMKSSNIGVVETVILAQNLNEAKEQYVTFRKQREDEFWCEVKTIEEKKLEAGILSHIDYTD